MKLGFVSTQLTLAIGYLFAFSGAALAAPVPLTLDDFVVPASPESKATFSTSTSVSPPAISFNDALPTGNTFQNRTMTFNSFPSQTVPNSVCAALIGGGTMSVAQGTGALGDVYLAYGAWATLPSGKPAPNLRLDMRDYTGLKFEFSGAEDSLNINVQFYTSTPIGSTKLYYSLSKVNVASSSGGPQSFTLALNKDPNFNWQWVDGVIVEINVANDAPATSYTLNKLTFVGQ